MSKTIDPNQLVTGQLRKLVDLLEAEKRDRFFNDPRPIHRAIQEVGAPPPECPPGHKMIVRVLVPPPRREEPPPRLEKGPEPVIAMGNGDDGFA
jgi:hypothetical protein